MEKFDPTLVTRCVGCRKKATKYCTGWDETSRATPHGSFAFGSECGYPVCDACKHVRGGWKQKHEPKGAR